MPMSPFVERFPELGARETRSVTVPDQQDLPSGEYGFFECYCNEPNCDCWLVVVVVLRPETGWEFWAVINYGWESVEFYKKWARALASDRSEWQGPELDRPECPDPLRTRASGSVQVGPAVSWLRGAPQKALPAFSDRGR